MADIYQQVAFMALRDDKGAFSISVPLYVKVSDVNKNGNTEEEAALMHRVSSVMMKHYDRQIAEHIANLKKGVKANGQA